MGAIHLTGTAGFAGVAFVAESWNASPASDCGNAFYRCRLGNNMASRLPHFTKLDFCN